MGVKATSWLAGALATLVVSGCATTDLKPVAQAGSTVGEARDEAEMWKRADELERYISRNAVRFNDPALEAYLDGVARRVAGDSVPTNMSVRVKVIQNPYLNAFALPNGAIFIHSGMLSALESEDQLAALLGHEMTHFTHRHALKQERVVRNRQPLTGVVQILFVSLGAMSGSPQLAQSMGELGGGVMDLWTMASVMGYSRDDEREADREGFALMGSAGYDVNEAPKLFEALKAESTNDAEAVAFFFSSHPRLDERIASYRELLAGAGVEPADLREPEADYVTMVSSTMVRNIVIDLELDREASARRIVDRLLAHRPDYAPAHFYQAEVLRREGDFAASHEAALAAYERALSIDPAYADAHREVGIIRRRLGHQSEAEAAFSSYLHLRPEAEDAGIVRSFLKETSTAEEATP